MNLLGKRNKRSRAAGAAATTAPGSSAVPPPADNNPSLRNSRDQTPPSTQRAEYRKASGSFDVPRGERSGGPASVPVGSGRDLGRGGGRAIEHQQRFSIPAGPSTPRYLADRNARFASLPTSGKSRPPSSSIITPNANTNANSQGYATPRAGGGGRNSQRQPLRMEKERSLSQELDSFHFPPPRPAANRRWSSSSGGSVILSVPMVHEDSLSLARKRQNIDRPRRNSTNDSNDTDNEEPFEGGNLLVSNPRHRLPSKGVLSVDLNPGGPPRFEFSVHTPIPPPQMKSFPFLNVKTVIRSLDESLKNDGKRIRDYMEVEEILSGKLWERADQEGLKDCEKEKKEKKSILREAENEWKERERQRHVFGGHLKNVAELTSKPFPIYGYMHQIPSLILCCVEEIRRSGMDERGLFIIPPYHDRITSLVASFDHPTTGTARLPDLAHESIHDVCSLLSTFLRSLPAPLFHRSFFDAMWAWCVGPTLTREAENHKLFRQKMRKNEYGDLEAQIDNTSSSGEDSDVEGFGGLPSFNSRRRKERKREREIEKSKWKAYALAHPGALEQYRSKKHEKRVRLEREFFALETHQIAVARLILMLLSQSSFSIIVYLLTFFNELLEHTPNNRLNYDKLGGMFGFKLLGGPSQGAAKTALCWLITRWRRIVDGFKSEESKNVCRRKVEMEGDPEQYSVPPVGRDSRFNVDPGENLRATKEQSPVARALPRRSGSASSSRRSSLSRSSSMSQEGVEVEQGQRRRASESATGLSTSGDYPRLLDPRFAEFEDALVLSPFTLDVLNERDRDQQDEDLFTLDRNYDGFDQFQDSGVGGSDTRGRERERIGRERPAFAAIEHLIQSESSDREGKPGDAPDNLEISSVYSGSDSEEGCEVNDLKKGSPEKLVFDREEGAAGDNVLELKRQLEAARSERDQAVKEVEKMRRVFKEAVGM